MHLDPPNLLRMYSLDSLDERLRGGRIILACAFKSGEIQAFINGPQPQACPANSERFKFERHMFDMGDLDKLLSWEFPTRITNQKGHCYKNLENAFEAHENNLQTRLPKDHKVEQITGLFNLSSNSGSSSFMMLQLTGWGAILCDSLKISEELGLSNHELSCAVSKKTAVVKTSSGKCKTKHYRMEYLPAFLQYVQCGKQNVYSSANSHHNENSAVNELCTKSKAKEEQKTEPRDQGNCSPYLEVQTTCSHHAIERPVQIHQENQRHQFQDTKLGNDGDHSNENFFCKLDTDFSPVNLCFNDTGGISLQSEELVVLEGFKNLFLQWQHNFQAYSNLNVNRQP